MATTALTREDFVGMGMMARARRDLMVKTFAGTKLKFGSSSAASTTKSLLGSAKKIGSSAKKIAGGGGSDSGSSGGSNIPGLKSAIEAFLVQCADVSGLDDIIEAITSQVVADIVAEVTPILGVFVSGGKLVKAGKAVVEDGRDLYKFSSYREGFRSGDPVAAADGIKTIIQRDLAKHSVQLAQQALATGAKIAGIFADMGTATTAGIGLANALASLGLELFTLGLAIKDLRAGNARLKTPETLDLTVFEECPVLGCYLLTCADTSAVANFFIADIGLPGWMDKIEKMKKTQMDPLLKIARKGIASSKIQLEGLSQNKATHKSQGFFASIKLKLG